ncbi:hypothetical protein KSP40_PGU009414 [Platanthera guangdongensis]|uniref:Uncharacterized protein n=1 Tax=Platanthera guangdongensis TaxID=2320717 RepID=A0ABR2MDV7_9ASPA
MQGKICLHFTHVVGPFPGHMLCWDALCIELPFLYVLTRIMYLSSAADAGLNSVESVLIVVNPEIITGMSNRVIACLQTGKLALVAILVASGIVLQFLACAVYNNWWPMLTVERAEVVDKDRFHQVNSFSEMRVRFFGGVRDVLIRRRKKGEAYEVSESTFNVRHDVRLEVPLDALVCYQVISQTIEHVERVDDTTPKQVIRDSLEVSVVPNDVGEGSDIEVQLHAQEGNAPDLGTGQGSESVNRQELINLEGNEEEKETAPLR